MSYHNQNELHFLPFLHANINDQYIIVEFKADFVNLFIFTQMWFLFLFALVVLVEMMGELCNKELQKECLLYLWAYFYQYLLCFLVIESGC
jgi:hypothetical protein